MYKSSPRTYRQHALWWYLLLLQEGLELQPDTGGEGHGPCSFRWTSIRFFLRRRFLIFDYISRCFKVFCSAPIFFWGLDLPLYVWSLLFEIGPFPNVSGIQRYLNFYIFNSTIFSLNLAHFFITRSIFLYFNRTYVTKET